jgi:hypothetical protein
MDNGRKKDNSPTVERSRTTNSDTSSPSQFIDVAGRSIGLKPHYLEE